MNIDKALISKLEKLSNLELSTEERDRIQADLNNMLAMVQKIEELDTEGVEPLTHMTTEVNQFRTDEVKGQLDREEALKNAPVRDEAYIKVPKVI
ncbi:MAG: aspartyl-tRNA(Asn)/glutamyl-tRNA(Gln) amidotransferase subunit C [Polaribacter sp.]|jgi:aspartyl-tRNA(Asn)/glutamyl-tRNA(Gln) amidotransferase subunit C